MQVTPQTLIDLSKGFQRLFDGALSMAPSQWNHVAMEVMSMSSEEAYGWMNLIPGMREWIGDRVIHNLSASDYSIKNKDYELTIGVQKNDIEDDRLGIYNPLFTEMGRSTGEHVDKMVYSLLRKGFETKCYDGQYFFDTDHPVINGNGDEDSVSNSQGGSGTAWYLIDDSRALKPIVYQNRKAADFVALDKPEDANVFHKKEFIYGTHARRNVGFALWQLSYASKETLNTESFEAAKAAMESQKGDHGRTLGIMPKKLIVPPTLEGKARRLIKAETIDGGNTNVWQDAVDVVVVPWLA